MWIIQIFVSVFLNGCKMRLFGVVSPPKLALCTCDRKPCTNMIPTGLERGAAVFGRGGCRI